MNPSRQFEAIEAECDSASLMSLCFATFVRCRFCIPSLKRRWQMIFLDTHQVVKRWLCHRAKSSRNRQLLHKNVQLFPGGLVFNAPRFLASLNSRLESDKEEETDRGSHSESGPSEVSQFTSAPISPESRTTSPSWGLGFVLALAGIRRRVVPTKAIENNHLIPL